MRTFDVYANSQGQAKAVKRGFSWPGFFFTWFWAFVKELPFIGLLLLPLSVLVRAFSWGAFGRAGESVGILFGLLMGAVVGFSGNDWVRNRLEREGYVLVDSIEAENGDSAIAVYCENLRSSSLEDDLTKTCPNCLKAIKLAAIRCRYCGREFAPDEVSRQVSEEVDKLQQQKRQALEQKQCPKCKSWDVKVGAYIEDGGRGDWCPHCNMSLQKMKTLGVYTAIRSEQSTPPAEANTPIVDKKLMKKCPVCAEFVKKESLVCEYCNEEFKEEKIPEQSLLEGSLEKDRQRRAAGERQCPVCKSWDIRRGAYIEDGGVGDWCGPCLET